MPTYNFVSESDAYAAVAALNVAAERYEADATAITESNLPAHARERLVRQFNDQAATARRLAVDIEENI